MCKQDFLTELRHALAGLPQKEKEERLSFYGEMIDDRMEEGLTEEEAVAGIGSIRDIVSQTVSDIPLTKLVKERVKPKRNRRGWEIVLIVLGFPLWFPLLVAAGAVILSLYVVLWSLILSLWAVEIALWACALAGLAGAAAFFLHGAWIPGAAMLGAGLFCVGLSVFLFFGCLAATKGTARLTKKILLNVKTLFIGKETAA